jgi:hypothetical protein
MSDRARLDQRQIAELLGVGLQAVKKWRGATRRALIAAGQLDSPAPTVRLRKNALPIPSNQVEHVRDGVQPRWDQDVIELWAERTERRHPVTKEPIRPTQSGPMPGYRRNPQPAGV